VGSLSLQKIFTVKFPTNLLRHSKRAGKTNRNSAALTKPRLRASWNSSSGGGGRDAYSNYKPWQQGERSLPVKTCSFYSTGPHRPWRQWPSSRRPRRDRGRPEPQINRDFALRRSRSVAIEHRCRAETMLLLVYEIDADYLHTSDERQLNTAYPVGADCSGLGGKFVLEFAACRTDRRSVRGPGSARKRGTGRSDYQETLSANYSPKGSNFPTPTSGNRAFSVPKCC
jgi:hypothetical protein